MFYLDAFSIIPTAPKTTLTFTPNTDTKIKASDIIKIVEDANWYKTASKDFKNKFQITLSDIEKNGKLSTINYTNNKATVSTELFISDAVLIDYVEASRRLINLGLQNQIINMPELPLSLQQKK